MDNRKWKRFQWHGVLVTFLYKRRMNAVRPVHWTVSEEVINGCVIWNEIPLLLCHWKLLTIAVLTTVKTVPRWTAAQDHNRYGASQHRSRLKKALWVGKRALLFPCPCCQSHRGSRLYCLSLHLFVFAEHFPCPVTKAVRAVSWEAYPPKTPRNKEHQAMVPFTRRNICHNCSPVFPAVLA